MTKMKDFYTFYAHGRISMATESFDYGMHIITQEDADRLNAAIEEMIANLVRRNSPSDLEELSRGVKGF